MLTLSFMLSGEKSSVIWIGISLYSYLTFLTIFLQDLVFVSFSEIQLWCILAYIYWGLLFLMSAHLLNSVGLLSHLAYFHYYFLKCSLLALKLQSTNVGWFVIVPYSSNSIHLLFLLYFLCCFIWLNAFIPKVTDSFICVPRTTN